MNKVILIGNICNDLELKESGETKVLSFNVAVQRKFKDKNGEFTSDFLRVTAFNQQAVFISKYFNKGMKIALEGRIQNDNFTDSEGKTQYRNNIIIEQVEFCNSKSNSTDNGGEEPNVNQAELDVKASDVPVNTVEVDDRATILIKRY